MPASGEAAPVAIQAKPPVGRGLRFGMVLHPQFPREVYVEGTTMRQSMLSKEGHGPRAVLNALERLMTGYANEIERTRQDLVIAESQQRDYQARVGKLFPLESYLSELTSLRNQLKAGLSATAQTQADEVKPNVAELAEEIKALKVAHSVEAAPQRIRQKQSAAEEPVTTRIRRRSEPKPVSERVDGDSSDFAGNPQEPERTSLRKPMTFQELIVTERQQKDDGPSPPSVGTQ